VSKNTKGVSNQKKLRNTALEYKVWPSAKYGLLKVAPELN